MDIKLYPRPVPTTVEQPKAGRQLHIWIGVFGATGEPVLKWCVNGASSNPTAVAPLSPCRPAGKSASGGRRNLSGVYEFQGLDPERQYRIGVAADGEEASVDVRTLPDVLSADPGKAFNVLLVSCYYQPEDRKALVSAVIDKLNGVQRPHLTLLLGDQVYLDLPTLTDFKDDTEWLEKRFETYYVRNWQGPGGLCSVLSSAPCVHIPDDHEYWNNAPHSSPVVGNSYSAEGRQRWRAAAETLYHAFQKPAALRLGEPFILDVPPLSFFLADSRSQRTENRHQSMDGPSKHALKSWCDRLVRDRLYGILATGQSLYDEPAGRARGKIADYSLSDYDDYPQIMGYLTSVPERGQPLLCVTGDVHWGRMTKSIDVKTNRDAFYEIISSPSALVATALADQLWKAGSSLGNLFGKSTPWPRHSSFKNPSDFLAMNVLGKQYASRYLDDQTGDQVTLLSFTRSGYGVNARVTYYPIHPIIEMRQPKIVDAPLQLRPY